MKWVGAALSYSTLVACASTPVQVAPIPVAMWRGGDDGLTLAFAEALEISLGASGRYRLTMAGERAAIVITITDHVIPLNLSGIDYFRYDVTFGRDADSTFGRSAGRCPQRPMRDCARRIVADMERALASR